MAPSRLLQAAHVLGVSVPFFFEGLDGTASEQGEDDTPQLGAINEFVSSHEGVRLIKAFSRIKSSAMRRSIVGLVEELALRDGE
jgi:hypothetical protein